MRKPIIAALFAGVSFALASNAAAAQEVSFTGEKCPLTIITDRAAYESGNYTVAYLDEEDLETEEQGAAEAQDASAESAAEADTAGAVQEAEDASADGAAETDAAGEAQEAQDVSAEGAAGAAQKSQEPEPEQLPAVMVCTLSGFEAMGLVNETYVAVVFAENKTGYALTEEILEKVPALKLEELESISGWTEIGRGSGGEYTVAVQQALADLKLLEGGVDGAFGGGTASSVMAFQKEEGLAETGAVDGATYFLLMDAAGNAGGANGASGSQRSAEPLVTPYPPVYTVEDKFAAICNDVEDPQILQAFLDPVWKFQYDVFDGVGRIDYTSEGIYLGNIETGSRFIDRLDLSGDVHVEVQRGEKNIVSVFPVIEINTLGSYRPYIQGATLKRGMAVTDLECVYTEGGLYGIDSTEKAWLLFSEDILKVIGAEAPENELVLRVHGLHQDYDMDLSAFYSQIAAFVGSYAGGGLDSVGGEDGDLTSAEDEEEDENEEEDQEENPDPAVTGDVDAAEADAAGADAVEADAAGADTVEADVAEADAVDENAAEADVAETAATEADIAETAAEEAQSAEADVIAAEADGTEADAAGADAAEADAA